MNYLHTVEPKSIYDTYEGFVITSDGEQFNTLNIEEIYPNGWDIGEFEERGFKISELSYFDIQLDDGTEYEFDIDDTDPSLWQKLLNMVQPT